MDFVVPIGLLWRQNQSDSALIIVVVCCGSDAALPMVHHMRDAVADRVDRNHNIVALEARV